MWDMDKASNFEVAGEERLGCLPFEQRHLDVAAGIDVHRLLP